METNLTISGYLLSRVYMETVFFCQEYPPITDDIHQQ